MNQDDGGLLSSRAKFTDGMGLLSKRRPRAGSLLVVLMLTLACWPGWASSAPSNDASLPAPPRIGAILPLTGDSAFWGLNARRGIELALEDLAPSAGIRLPRVLFEDDGCDAKAAVAAFRRLVDVEGVRFVLGPVCSSATLAVAPLAEARDVLLLPFSESDSIATGGHVLRLWVPNGKQGRLMAQYIVRERRLRSVAILSVSNAFGADISSAFRDELQKLGGIVVADVEYDASSASLRGEVLRVKQSKPDAIFLASYIADGMRAVRTMHELGISTPLFASSTIAAPEFFAGTKGMFDELVWADLPDKTHSEFRSRWTKTFGDEWPGAQSGAPIFYDVTLELARWLGSHPSDSKKFKSHLLQLKVSGGGSGMLEFAADGNLTQEHQLFKLRDGERVSAE